MLKLEDIWKNTSLNGIEPGQTVRIATTEPVGTDALTVYYKTTDGRVMERMLYRTGELKLSLTEVGRPWAFDANGAEFKRSNLDRKYDDFYDTEYCLQSAIICIKRKYLPPRPAELRGVSLCYQLKIGQNHLKIGQFQGA